MKTPLLGPFESKGDGHPALGSLQHIALPMRRYRDGDEVDYVIVGCGSGGGGRLQRLSRAGFRVVALEAGPFWNTERDWVSDESGSHKLYREDLRITGGTDPLAFGANNSGKGVGGGSVHWASIPSAPSSAPADCASSGVCSWSNRVARASAATY